MTKKELEPRTPDYKARAHSTFFYQAGPKSTPSHSQRVTESCDPSRDLGIFLSEIVKFLAMPESSAGLSTGDTQRADCKGVQATPGPGVNCFLWPVLSFTGGINKPFKKC